MAITIIDPNEASGHGGSQATAAGALEKSAGATSKNTTDFADVIAKRADLLIDRLAKPGVAWPSVSVSAVGALLLVGILVSEFLRPSALDTAEYIATLIIATILTLSGPVSTTVDRASSRTLTAKTGSEIVKAEIREFKKLDEDWKRSLSEQGREPE